MIKLILKIFLLIFIINVNADYDFEGDIAFNKPYVFVSLGCNCWQAQSLRLKAHGLRDAAFPFDWLFTNDVDGLITCLDERFAQFLNESHFSRLTGADLAAHGQTGLQNNYYKFIFTHDWPYQGQHVTHELHKGQLGFINQKYTRRIARFKSLEKFQGKVFFMRCFQTDPNYKGHYAWNAHNARRLNESLKRFFPDLDFTLVVVSCTEKEVSEIGNVEGVKEYKIKDLTNWDCYASMLVDLLAECR